MGLQHACRWSFLGANRAVCTHPTEAAGRNLGMAAVNGAARVHKLDEKTGQNVLGINVGVAFAVEKWRSTRFICSGEFTFSLSARPGAGMGLFREANLPWAWGWGGAASGRATPNPRNTEAPAQQARRHPLKQA